MNNITLKIFSTLVITIISYSLNAQTQTINYGDVKNYSVDTVAPDTPEGTPGSTYNWTVFDNVPTDITSSGTLTITQNTTSGNDITIDWGTTSPGEYTLHVQETNNGCLGEEKLITVIISNIGEPTLTASNALICFGDPTTFSIAGAQANSIITYNVTGGTDGGIGTVTTDASGNTTITVTADITGVTLIEVSLTSMELANGTVVTFNPAITATTTINVVETTDITFN